MARRQRRLYVGVDVGGTNIAAALVDASGNVLARERLRTPVGGAPQECLDAIADAVKALLANEVAKGGKVEAAGVGVAGVVDSDAGVAVATPNMNLSGLAVVEPLQERLGIPVALGNDVDMGTLGEEWLGAARGAQSVVGIFWGTGIGGGIIQGGRLVRGARMAAGEIGHIVMEVDGPLCGCGNRGCFEALASRTAIERDIRQAMKDGRETALTKTLDGDSRVRSGALKKALRKGDDLTVEVMTRAAEVVGYACLTVRHLMDPEVIVLGGGVVEACGDFVMPIVTRVMASDKLPGARAGGRLARSMLGDDAGVLGAAALAQQHAGRTLRPPKRPSLPEYPTLEADTFGEVRVGEDVYERDTYLRADGQPRKRNKAAAKSRYGTSHVIGPEELARACRGNPDLLVVGTGHSGTAELTDDALDFLRESGILLEALTTPEAAEAYNRAGGRKAALIHVTC